MNMDSVLSVYQWYTSEHLRHYQDLLRKHILHCFMLTEVSKQAARKNSLLCIGIETQLLVVNTRLFPSEGRIISRQSKQMV